MRVEPVTYTYTYTYIQHDDNISKTAKSSSFQRLHKTYMENVYSARKGIGNSCGSLESYVYYIKYSYVM